MVSAIVDGVKKVCINGEWIEVKKVVSIYDRIEELENRIKVLESNRI